MLPAPAPTSHSSSPGRDASAASVTARIGLLGDLPVVDERVIGQRRHALVGQVAHRDDVEVVDVAWRPRRPLPCVADRRRSAGPPSCSSTVISESPRPCSVSSRASVAGDGAVARHHDGLPAATHRGVRFGGDQADHLGVLDRPPDPRARQRHRRHMRQHGDPVGVRTAGSACCRYRAAAGRRWPPRARRPRRRRAACRSAGNIGDGHSRRSPVTLSSSRSSWRREP